LETHPVQATDVPRRSPNATHQAVGEEAILVDLNTGTYYSLNDTGAMFWELLDGQRTISACAQAIAAEYDVEVEQVEADLLELAAEFQQEGLILV
jgi:hypothetical protein